MYPTLKDNANWPNWRDQLIAIMISQGLAHLMDPSYEPMTPQDAENFHKQNAFLWQVFSTKVETTTGKALVRKHSKTLDARALMQDLETDATSSATGVLRQRSLRLKIATCQISRSTVKSQLSFLIAFDTLVSRHNEFSATPDLEISPIQAKEFLLTAVSGAPNLKDVSTRELEYRLDKQAPPYTYQQYFGLLSHSAAMHDGVTTPKALDINMSRYSDNDFDSVLGLGGSNDTLGIDVFAADSRPRLPESVFKPLSKAGKQNWSNFSDTDRACFVEAMSETATGTRSVNVATVENPDAASVAPEPGPTEEPAIEVNKADSDTATPTKPIADTHPGDPRRMMSQPATTRPNATKTTSGLMARFQACHAAVDNHWKDTSPVDASSYWDDPDDITRDVKKQDF
jgi:hypothetical protein